MHTPKDTHCALTLTKLRTARRTAGGNFGRPPAERPRAAPKMSGNADDLEARLARIRLAKSARKDRRSVRGGEWMHDPAQVYLASCAQCECIPDALHACLPPHARAARFRGPRYRRGACERECVLARWAHGGQARLGTRWPASACTLRAP